MGLSLMLYTEQVVVPDKAPYEGDEMLEALFNNQWKRRRAEIEYCM